MRDTINDSLEWINLDELDIYLDYLDNNQTDKYNCFSITFEIPPL